MAITYSHPRSLENDWKLRAEGTRKQLDSLRKQRDDLVHQQSSDPYGWEWKTKLPAVRQLIGHLESQLRQEENSAGIHRGDVPPALSSGSYWRKDE